MILALGKQREASLVYRAGSRQPGLHRKNPVSNYMCVCNIYSIIYIMDIHILVEEKFKT